MRAEQGSEPIHRKSADPRRRAVLPILLHALPYAFVLLYCVWNADTWIRESEYHVDETGWILSSEKVFRHLAARSGDWEDWAIDGTAYGHLNPQLGKVLFAIPIAFLMRRGEPPEFPRHWDFSISTQENIEQGVAVADWSILRPLRLTALIMGLVLVLTLMGCAHKIAGPIAALATGLYCFHHGAMLEIFTTVLTDSAYLALLIPCMLCGVALQRSNSSRQTLLASIGTGFTLAVCTSIKLPAPLIVLPFVVLLLAVKTRAVTMEPPETQAAASRPEWAFGWKGMVRCLAVVLVTWTIVTTALNPFAWPGLAEFSLREAHKEWRLLTRGEVAGDLEHRGHVMSVLTELDGNPLPMEESEVSSDIILPDETWREFIAVTANWMIQPNYQPVPKTHPARTFPQLHALARPAHMPLLYVRWNEYKKFLYRDYHWRGATTRDRLFSPLRTLRRTEDPFPGWSVFVVLGLLQAGVALRRRANAFGDERFAFMVFTACVSAIVLATALADAERYLTPIYALLSIWFGVGVATAARAVPVLTAWLAGRGPLTRLLDNPGDGGE